MPPVRQRDACNRMGAYPQSCKATERKPVAALA